jgi:S-DNA-T family DNA segregation ATPase FtsK/SpoIIIE
MGSGCLVLGNFLSGTGGHFYAPGMARKTSEDGPVMDKGLRDVIGIVLLAMSLFFLVALFSFDPRDLSFYRVPANPEANLHYNNMAGLLGASIANFCFFVFGAAAYLLPPALLLTGLGQFFDLLGFLRRRWPWLLVWGVCLMGMLDLFPDSFERVRERIGAPSAGGYLGMFLNDYVFEALIGRAGAAIFFVVSYLLGFIYLTNFQLNDWVRTWRVPEMTFMKSASDRETELREKAAELEKEAKRLKRAMAKFGDSLPLDDTPSKKKTEKPAAVVEAVTETEVEEVAEDDLFDVPEPTIRDLSQPTQRPEAKAEEEVETEDEGETSASDDGEDHVMGEGETISADEVRKAASTADVLGDGEEGSDSEDEASDADEEGGDDPNVEIVPPPSSKKKAPRNRPIAVAATPMIKDYRLPKFDFLHYAQPSTEPSETKEELLENAMLMKRVLQQFKIDVSPGDITKGPTITRYELHPAPGVKLEKIANLGNNLTAALKAERINILAPIPGKSSVGIEVPNRVKTMVVMRDLFESPAWLKTKLKIPVALGKDVYGQPLIGDLAEMPHLLIAGSTGSGKSVCISSIVASLMYRFSPDDLRMVMIDPKVVELQLYNKLPHLVVPVVTDPKKVILALRWVVNEMENRYKIFAKVGVRNVHGFNKRSKEKDTKSDQPELPLVARKETVEAGAEGFAVEVDEEIVVSRDDDIVIPDKLSYIVVIVDELADLMLVAPADVEMAIARITQMARAAGIHMIVATQRPSVDVITGVIKANIPARIAFQVASKVDSRTILDAMGADKLLGKGDMLYLPPGSAKLIRAQGAFIDDEEIAAVVDFIANQGKPSYEMSIKQQLDKPAAMADVEQGASNEDEDLIESCIEVIRSEQKASVSLMQRRLRLGYTRAARIMDELEVRGIVGPSRGAEPREILIDLDGQGYDGG